MNSTWARGQTRLKGNLCFMRIPAARIYTLDMNDFKVVSTLVFTGIETDCTS